MKHCKCINHNEARLFKSLLTNIIDVLSQKVRLHALYDAVFTVFISYKKVMYCIILYLYAKHSLAVEPRCVGISLVTDIQYVHLKVIRHTHTVHGVGCLYPKCEFNMSCTVLMHS